MSESYLNSIPKQFSFYRMRGDETITQVSDKDLFWKYDSDGNSIARLVQQISGNTLSLFTDLLTSDGEKEWRNRDS